MSSECDELRMRWAQNAMSSARTSEEATLMTIERRERSPWALDVVRDASSEASS